MLQKPYTKKSWYSTIVEKFITYGAAIWGRGSLTKAALNKLFSMQRIYFLISRSYTTISNDILNILASIPLIFIIIKDEFTKSNMLHLKNETNSQQYFPQMTDASVRFLAGSFIRQVRCPISK